MTSSIEIQASQLHAVGRCLQVPYCYTWLYMTLVETDPPRLRTTSLPLSTHPLDGNGEGRTWLTLTPDFRANTNVKIATNEI